MVNQALDGGWPCPTCGASLRTRVALRLHQNEKHDGTYTVPGSAGHASLEPSKADESPSTYKRKRDAGSDDEDFSSHVEVSTAMPAYKEITVEIDDGNLDVRTVATQRFERNQKLLEVVAGAITSTSDVWAKMEAERAQRLQAAVGSLTQLCVD